MGYSGFCGGGACPVSALVVIDCKCVLDLSRLRVFGAFGGGFP